MALKFFLTDRREIVLQLAVHEQWRCSRRIDLRMIPPDVVSIEEVNDEQLETGVDCGRNSNCEGPLGPGVHR
jgi:hypothetical protein